LGQAACNGGSIGPQAGIDAEAAAYLGLGSNQGDSERLLAQAVEMVGRLPHTRVEAVSRMYRTAPVGGPEQPDYLNQVAAIATGLSPRELLAGTQGIEQALGRIRTVRWGPRTMDIDILWYYGVTVSEADLEVPHPRAGQRRFVLAPWAEIAPSVVLPGGRTVQEALEALQGQAVELLPAG